MKPQIKISVSEENIFIVISKAARILKAEGYKKEEINDYLKEVTGQDYRSLIDITSTWFEII